MSSTTTGFMYSNDKGEEWLGNNLSFEILLNPLNPVPNSLKNVERIYKLQGSLQDELVKSISSDKWNRLPHFYSMVKCIWPVGEEDENGFNEILPKCPSAVCKRFPFSGPNLWSKKRKYLIDIVSWNGCKWYKVCSRSPAGLAKGLEAFKKWDFTEKSILYHASNYLKCAQENPCQQKPPQVAIIFTRGVTEQVAMELEIMNVEVIGKRIEDDKLDIWKDDFISSMRGISGMK